MRLEIGEGFLNLDFERGYGRPLNAYEVGVSVGRSWWLVFYTLAILVVVNEKQWMSVKSEERTKYRQTPLMG